MPPGGGKSYIWHIKARYVGGKRSGYSLCRGDSADPLPPLICEKGIYMLQFFVVFLAKVAVYFGEVISIFGSRSLGPCWGLTSS